ncbi:Intermediate filament protein [Kappamyces sp. JEL0829]|nr:Intermediate filament protein [Kappamyces sp. JEL0829]
MNGTTVLTKPRNYVVLIVVFLTLRYFLFYFLYHLSALFGFLVLYGIYSSVAKLIQKDRKHSQSTSQFLLSDEEGRTVGRMLGKASRAYPLANGAAWQKHLDSSKKEVYATAFFSKIIRNEPAEAVLRDILSFVQRDFVASWYNANISPNPGFLSYVDYVLHYAVAELYSRAQNIDATQLILVRIVAIVTTHVREVQSAERLLRASRLPNSKDPDEMNRQLAQHYCQGKLHPALTASAPDTLPTEYAWLRKRLKPLIPLLIPRKDSSSGIVMVLLREILMTCLLRPIVNNFSQPDYWNQLFDSLGGFLLDQQQQSHVLRKPSEYLPDLLDSALGATKNDPPSFDTFLRQIGSCSNLPDAIKIRDNILAEIERKSTSIAGCSSDDIIHGTKVSKIQGYINRLQVALKRVDKVIAKLTMKSKRTSRMDLNDTLTLAQCLEDASLLPFFDDYLNMTGRTPLLQYWVSATSFQDQLCLEKTIQTFEDELDQSIVDTWDLTSVAVNVCDLWKDFFAPDASLKISQFVGPRIHSALESFVEVYTTSEAALTLENLTKDATCNGVKCILLALQDIIQVMKTDDFPAFLKHPIGQKLMSRITGSNNPLRFLRPNRSPERGAVQDRVSLDSERSGEEDDDQTPKKKISSSVLGSMFKMNRRGSKGSRSPWSAEDREDLPYTSPLKSDGDDGVEGELHGIIHSEENSFVPLKKSSKAAMKRISPFFGDRDTTLKMQIKAEEIASSGKAFLESFRKRKSGEVLGHTRSNSASRSSFDKEPSSPALGDAPRISITKANDTEMESFIKLEIEDQNQPTPIDEDVMALSPQEAMPPMIILPAKFFELDASLEKLQKEFEVYERDLKDSEKENNPEKQRGLGYAKRGIWHEIQDIMAEKQSIERTELENVILPGRVTLSIANSHVLEQEGKEYAVYPIQVNRLNSEGTSSGWIVFRRYSQFVTLHQDLKAKFPVIMQQYELPGKLISGIMRRRSFFLESRRESLEKYLMNLIHHPEICKFQVFRRFICHPSIIKLLYGSSDLEGSPTKKSFLKSVFHNVDDTVDAMFQKQRNKTAGHSPLPVNSSSYSVFSHQPVSSATTPEPLLSENEPISSSAEPIIDLFVELFEIKGLRRQAIVIFLQNLFGDTVERRLTESLRDTLSNERLLAVITSIRDNFWPSGVWNPTQPVRLEEEKVRTKFEASSKIIQLFPELFGGMVGRQNARKGAIRVCTVFQNPRLNQHLMYRILDEILFVLFPKL